MYWVSPATAERRSRTTKSFRSSARSRSSASTDWTPLPAVTPPSQKTLPCTAASWRRSFSGRGSASSRAAITPCTDSGRSPVVPRSASMRTYCSAKSGLPPARSSSVCWSSASCSGWSSKLEISCVVSSSSSGCSEMRGRVRLSAAPGRPSLQQLRPRRPDDHQRRVAKEVDEVVQELEQAVVGPVQVLEDEDGRAALGDGVEEPSPGGRRRLRRALPAVARRARRARAARPRASAPPLPPGRAARPARWSFRSASSGRVGLEDPGLRLHDLAERPERDALAVGNATPLAPADQLALVLCVPEELADEPRLADAGDADEGDELRRVLLLHAPERSSAEARAHARARRAATSCARRGRLRTGRRNRPLPTRESAPPSPSRLPGEPRGTRSRVAWRGRSSPRPGSRSPGQPTACRAAVLTTSPATIPSPSAGRASTVTSASPVLTAMRIWSAGCSTAQSRIASAARTARSGSSSCAGGAPKTAITASPMNFSTVPPCRSSSSRRRAWYGASSAAHVLGVEPLAERGEPDEIARRRCVTILRSSPERAARSAQSGSAGVAEPGRRRGSRWPQAGQVSMSEGYDAQLAAMSSSRQSLQWPSPL